MSVKTQHNNILLAVLGIVVVVAIVAIIGLFAFGHTDEEIQGEIEVTEYRVSSKGTTCQGGRLCQGGRHSCHSRRPRGGGKDDAGTKCAECSGSYE